MSREERVETFVSFYPAALQTAIEKKPGEYVFSASEIPAVVGRMRQAFIKGSYNHDGYAMGLVCKQVGIKHTRKAMEQFFNS